MIDLLEVAVDICTEDYAPLWNVVGFIIKVIQIGIPILLIVIGMIDFAKAVIADKEDVQKKVMKTIGKRFLYAIGVFASVWIVTVVLDLAADTVGKNNKYYKYDETSWTKCWKLITGNDDNTTITPEKIGYCYVNKKNGKYVWSETAGKYANDSNYRLVSSNMIKEDCLNMNSGSSGNNSTE